MSAPKFTPGPWRIERSNDGEDWTRGAWDLVAGKGQDRVVLASRAPWSKRAVESEANAHLVAAAPDMFEALARLVAAIYETTPSFTPRLEQALDLAVDAAAKAIGDKP